MRSGSSPAKLFDLVAGVAAAADEARPSASTPADVVRLWRIALAAQTTTRLQHSDMSSVKAESVARATLDAEIVLRALRQARTPGPVASESLELAARVCDRIMEDVGYCALATDPTTAAAGTPGRHVSDASAQPLRQLARHYEDDAKRDRSWSVWLGLAALLLVGGAAVLAFAGIDAARGAHDTFKLDVYAAYGFVSVMLVATAATMMVIASRLRAAANAAARLHHELDGLEAYLAPMPPALGALLRGTLAQRLFPPARENDEPWHEPRWPDTETLMAAIARADQTP